MCLGFGKEPDEELQDEINQFTGAEKWKQLMRAFREEVKGRRRRRKLFKTFDNCFSGREAVEWLQVYLREHEVKYRRELNELHVVHLMELLLRCGFIVCLWQHMKCRNPLDVRKNLYSFSPLVDSLHNMTQKLFLAFVLSSPMK